MGTSCDDCGMPINAALYARTGGHCKKCFHDLQQIIRVRECTITLTDETVLSFWLTEEEFESEIITDSRINQKLEDAEYTLADVLDIAFGEEKDSDETDYIEDFQN